MRVRFMPCIIPLYKESRNLISEFKIDQANFTDSMTFLTLDVRKKISPK